MFIQLEEYLSTLPTIKLQDGRKLSSSTSKGNQSKWYLPSQRLFVKESFYNQGIYWKDYICEELTYNVGLQFGLSIAITKACNLDSGVPGSYSENFLNDDETFESFRNMQKSCSNLYIRKDFILLEPAEIFEALCSQYKETCNLDAEAYLADMFLLDHLIGNEDRHLNNFGAILNTNTRSYRFAPIFDNGLSLLEHSTKYAAMSADEALYSTNQRPFNTRFDIVYKNIPHTSNGTVLKVCKLNDLVFPSLKAYEYFQKAAEVLNIPLIGEPLVIKET